MTEERRKELEEKFAHDAESLYKPFPREIFDKYNVKRGLRYKDGTGVMAGLTSVGEVAGYYIENGEKQPIEGHLRYRGYDISDIVKSCRKENRYGFEEVIYLLLLGHLPVREAYDKMKILIGKARELPVGFTEDMILRAPSANIMNKLARSVLALYSYDPNPDEITVANLLRQSIYLIARLPVMAAYGYQAKAHYHDGKSLFLHAPQQDLSTSENFLYMIRPDNMYSEEEAKMLDTMLMIHAEHGGGNNSTFVTRVVSSSGTDTYSAIAAAIGSLKGPKHGGANAKVMGMMKDIETNVHNWNDREEVRKYLAKLIRGEAYDGSGLVYGMGHAVYTLSDPRAILIKNQVATLASHNPEFEKEFGLYQLVEELTPEVFAEVKKSSKVMCANVDLYSGFIYKVLGIPEELYTPLFAISRAVGWSAHRIEEAIGSSRIIRPAYKSISKAKPYVNMDDRTVE